MEIEIKDQRVELLKEKVEQVKAHFKKHKMLYAIGGTAVLSAGITAFVMRGIASRHISRGISVATNRGISVVADRSVVTNNVSLIESRRQGGPSWVIRCCETDTIFTSQRKAALAMELAESEISKHLNGVLDEVRGYHFERICLAA